MMKINTVYSYCQIRKVAPIASLSNNMNKKEENQDLQQKKFEKILTKQIKLSNSNNKQKPKE